MKAKEKPEKFAIVGIIILYIVFLLFAWCYNDS